MQNRTSLSRKHAIRLSFYTNFRGKDPSLKSAVQPAHSSSLPMKYSSNVKHVIYLKSHAAGIIADITDTREPYLITQNGEAKLIVMDIKSYEEQLETFSLLKLLAMGSIEIEKGEIMDITTIIENGCQS